MSRLQELRTLRETREGLDDQIDRLEWAINHGTHDSLSALTSSSASEEDDAADEELLEVRLAEAGSTTNKGLSLDHAPICRTCPACMRSEPCCMSCDHVPACLSATGRLCAGGGKFETAAGRGARKAPTVAAGPPRALSQSVGPAHENRLPEQPICAPGTCAMIACLA